MGRDNDFKCLVRRRFLKPNMASPLPDNNPSWPVESLNYLINMKRNEIALIEKEDKVSIKLTADTKLSPGQYTLTVEKIEEEKHAAKEEKRAEHKALHPAEHKTEHRVEHKAEQRVEHKAEGRVEHKAEQTSDQTAEPERRPKRRSRSRGRRRPRYGTKPVPAVGNAPASAGETSEAEVEVVREDMSEY